MNITFTGDDSSSTVAWRSSALTIGYRVYQLSSAGRVPVCLTSNLSCEVSGLQVSNVAVTAWNSAGESLASRVATGKEKNMGLWVIAQMECDVFIFWMKMQFPLLL